MKCRSTLVDLIKWLVVGCSSSIELVSNLLLGLNVEILSLAPFQTMSFLELEGYHVFITGAAGGIGSEAAQEFLSKAH